MSKKKSFKIAYAGLWCTDTYTCTSWICKIKRDTYIFPRKFLLWLHHNSFLAHIFDILLQHPLNLANNHALLSSKFSWMVNIFKSENEDVCRLIHWFSFFRQCFCRQVLGKGKRQIFSIFMFRWRKRFRFVFVFKICMNKIIIVSIRNI